MHEEEASLASEGGLDFVEIKGAESGDVKLEGSSRENKGWIWQFRKVCNLLLCLGALDFFLIKKLGQG